MIIEITCKDIIKWPSSKTKSYFEGQILILEILIENLQSEVLDTTTRD
jgi:hypothetical protein